MTVKAGIYTRISADRDATGLGVTRQETACRELCATRRWEVAEIHTDNDLSAYSGRPRPAYEALLESIQSARIDAVIAWHPDRLHRSPTELERFIDIIESAGTKVATVQGGEYDLSTAAGRMTARVVGAVSRHESEHKSERHRAKAAELALAGRVGGGGTRPYGYQPDRRSVEGPEARVIRECAGRVLAGETLGAIATDLNARQVPTVTGAPWRTHVLRRLLCSPRIAGLREHQGVVVAAAEWPAIIARAQHEQLTAVLTDPARRTNHVPHRYLLTGLAYCGLCGARLVARPRDDRRRAYVCSSGPNFDGCGKIKVLAESPRGLDATVAAVSDPAGVEELVVALALSLLDSSAFARRLARVASPDVDEAVAEVMALEGRLVELAELWGAGELDRRSWLAARAGVEGRLEAARRGLRVRPSGPVGEWAGRGGALRGAWPGLGFDRRRALLAGLVDRVTVGPAVRGRNRFDPARVTIGWC